MKTDEIKSVHEIGENDYKPVEPGTKVKVAPLKNFLYDDIYDFEGKRLIFTAKKDLNFLRAAKEKYLGFELIVGVIFGDGQIPSLKEAEFVGFVITFKDPQEIRSGIERIKPALVLD